MFERREIDEVLARDEELDGYEDSTLVFTDISLNLQANVSGNFKVKKRWSAGSHTLC